MKDFILSPIISDGMIIQRETPFPVWTSKKVNVTFSGKLYESKKTGDKWLVILDPVKAGGPFVLELSSDTESFRVNDIYAGDVWLCGGQSNMEMMMQRLADDFSEEWDTFASADLGSLVVRQFKVPQEFDFSSEHDNISGGGWLSATSDTLHEFSGTAWFFAKNINKKYGIPIGLINTAWGGTPIESWMSSDALKDYPDKIQKGRYYANPKIRDEVAGKTQSAINEWETHLKNEDAGLKNQWQSLKTNTSFWKDIELPCNFSSAGLNDFRGVIWLSKDFDISADFSHDDAKLWLGTIVDADTVFVNGIEIGNTAYRYPPRKYIPKGTLKKGKNRVMIRVTCNNGDGGVTSGKPFRVFTDSETIELSGTWKYKVAAAVPIRPEDFFFQRQPMGNFNSMIAPVLKFPLKGAIWYQGESNDSYPHDYEALFQLMINDWRKKYNENMAFYYQTGQFSVNQKENEVNKNERCLPFFFVQLPIWKEASENNENSSWAIIRDAQRKALSLPKTGMACALELGEWNDLHPVNKKDIGYRLYLASEQVLENAGNTSPGPIINKIKKEDKKIYLSFDNCGDGLCVLNDPPKVNLIANPCLRTLEFDESEENENNDISAFVSVITEQDISPVRLPAEIASPDTISVDLSNVKNPKKILYAWADNPIDRQLFNSEGLPVIPFKIDL
ncbi:MAG: sialate O-acetylesterase [Treponema sp.]|nr:sialate O-acetylesterase [Treponema sp.]